MIVSRITSGNDWTFGRGRADYLRRSAAIAQTVKTRLRSFTQDWFLDTTANIDWIGLLSVRNSERQIRREIERVTLATEGVARVDELTVRLDAHKRAATYSLRYTDIYDASQRLDGEES